MKKVTCIFALVSLLGGCASTDIEDMPHDARVRFANMEGYTNNPFPASSQLGEAVGVSCVRNVNTITTISEFGGNIFASTRSADVATQGDALQDLRYKAAMMGGDAVVNAVCKSGGTDWVHNCWSTVKCVADVVKK